LEQPEHHGERGALSGGHLRCRDYSTSVDGPPRNTSDLAPMPRQNASDRGISRNRAQHAIRSPPGSSPPPSRPRGRLGVAGDLWTVPGVPVADEKYRGKALHDLKRERFMTTFTMPFVKHKSQAISAVPADYLEWMRDTMHDLRPATQSAIEAGLKRRQ